MSDASGPGSRASHEAAPASSPEASIPIAGGWSLVRCDEYGRDYRDWFLCNPRGIWVAKFWDGPKAGERDARAFAAALAQVIEDAPKGNE